MELQEQCFIYVLKDPLTDVIKYVGKTKNVNRRRIEHNYISKKFSSKKSNWVPSLKRKGLTPTLEVIEVCDVNNWIEREIFWIKFYKAQGIELKNTAEGGGGNHGMKMSDESRLRMSKAKKEIWKTRVISEEELHNRHLAGKRNYEMYNPLKEYWVKARVPILQYTKEGEFIKEWESIKLAEETLNLNGCIHSILSRKDGLSGGFIWKYKDEDKESKRKDTRTNPRKQILQYDLDCNFIKEWYSIIEVATTLNISRKTISKCLYKTRKQCGGFIWKFKDEELAMSIEQNSKKQGTKVIQYTLDGIFVKNWDTIKIASETSGISNSNIMKCLYGKRKHAGGYLWKYADNNKNLKYKN